MFGRVTQFTVAPDHVDAGIDFGDKTVLPGVLALGGLGMTMLTNRQTGAGYAITWWNDEASAQTSDAGANQLRDAFKQAVDATVLDVHTYEVVLDVDTHAATPLAARVTPSTVDPARRAATIEFIKENILPSMQSQPGFCRYCLMSDLQGDKGFLMTLWESAAARDANTALVNQLRSAVTQASDAQLGAAEMYDVARLSSPGASS